MRSVVIINPRAGRGRKRKQAEELFQQLASGSKWLETTHAGHATELAFDAVQNGFTQVIACGGDGTVHEVATGILKAGNPQITFAVWPLGSGNDFAFALGLLDWWKNPKLDELEPLQVDVGELVIGTDYHYFFNGMGMGFNGKVVERSRSIRWLRGLPLYSLAILKALLWDYRPMPLEMILNEHSRSEKLVALTINLGPREGTFPTLPDAQLTDGYLKLILVRDLSRLGFMRMMPRMALGNLPRNHPKIDFQHAEKVVVTTKEWLPIHVDGELVSNSSFAGEPLVVTILKSALKTLRWKRQPKKNAPMN